MAMRNKNPVNNYFIYNDESRKSTCKECYFDMAGRHSENLIRHLKRKHPSTYAKVMLEKQRYRPANAKKRDADKTSPPLSSMFRFDTEPHKLFIKSVATAETSAIVLDFENDDDEDSSNQMTNEQIDDIYITKSEIQMEETSERLSDSNESLAHQTNQIEDNTYLNTNMLHQLQQQQQQLQQLQQQQKLQQQILQQQQQNQQQQLQQQQQKQQHQQLQQQQQQLLQQMPLNSLNAIATPNATCTKPMPIIDPISTTTTTTTLSALANPDDTYFMQYLGNKFSKYPPNTKNTVQFHINRILYKADMGCYDNVDSSKLSDTD